MNCADSTERPLKLPEPVFHCVDIFHHQPDNIDVPSGIPAHEELLDKIKNIDWDSIKPEENKIGGRFDFSI